MTQKADAPDAVEQRTAPARDEMDRLVGDGPAILELKEQIRGLATVDYTVLVEGETGTGKDVVAWLLHATGRRGSGPFVVVNCAALPETLFESEVFGHGRGAFTGATSEKAGLIEIANQGTLVLDEIGELAMSMQAKLLQVLESGTFHRLGNVRPTHVDVRVVAATNRDLTQMVSQGRFRPDLYYRLRVVSLKLAPLRERKSDILPLARHFLADIGRRLSQKPRDLSEEAAAALCAYAWPGNVRQLLHELEAACVRGRDGRVEAADIAPEIRAALAATYRARKDGLLSGWEREEIARGLERMGWNVSALARELRMSRRTLTAKISRLGLKRPHDRRGPA